MDPSKYENIIFDFGGVILNIDVQRTIDAFSSMAHTNIANLTHQIITDPLFYEFEMGLVSEPDFRDGICKLLGLDLEVCSDDVFDHAWNALLLDIPVPRLELIKSLAGNHRIFLLSNTNSIHIRQVSKIVNSTIQKPSIDHLFENAYYSHQVNMRKPNKDIYEHVLQQNTLKPSETLFLDDNPINFSGAHAAGISTLEVNRDILEIFS
jgi:putative hydrolase of the HAD superfamily